MVLEHRVATACEAPSCSQIRQNYRNTLRSLTAGRTCGTVLTSYALAGGGASRLKERDQNCQWQDFVTGLCNLIKAKREPWLLGERAEPFAIIIDEAPKLPLRQLKFDQCKGRIGPSAGFDQPIELGFRGRTSCAANRTHASAITSDISSGVSASGATKLLLKPIKALFAFRIEQHDTSQMAAA